MNYSSNVAFKTAVTAVEPRDSSSEQIQCVFVDITVTMNLNYVDWCSRIFCLISIEMVFFKISGKSIILFRYSLSSLVLIRRYILKFYTSHYLNRIFLSVNSDHWYIRRICKNIFLHSANRLPLLPTVYLKMTTYIPANSI